MQKFDILIKNHTICRYKGELIEILMQNVTYKVSAVLGTM